MYWLFSSYVCHIQLNNFCQLYLLLVVHPPPPLPQLPALTADTHMNVPNVLVVYVPACFPPPNQTRKRKHECMWLTVSTRVHSQLRVTPFAVSLFHFFHFLSLFHTHPFTPSQLIQHLLPSWGYDTLTFYIEPMETARRQTLSDWLMCCCIFYWAGRWDKKKKIYICMSAAVCSWT